MIYNISMKTEEAVTVKGLDGSTDYDVYFAEGEDSWNWAGTRSSRTRSIHVNIICGDRYNYILIWASLTDFSGGDQVGPLLFRTSERTEGNLWCRVPDYTSCSQDNNWCTEMDRGARK